MQKEQADTLMAQLAADAVVRDALLIALMEQLPGIHGAIEAKVAAAAPVAIAQLSPDGAAAFRLRLKEVLDLMRNA